MNAQKIVNGMFLLMLCLLLVIVGVVAVAAYSDHVRIVALEQQVTDLRRSEFRVGQQTELGIRMSAIGNALGWAAAIDDCAGESSSHLATTYTAPDQRMACAQNTFFVLPGYPPVKAGVASSKYYLIFSDTWLKGESQYFIKRFDEWAIIAFKEPVDNKNFVAAAIKSGYFSNMGTSPNWKPTTTGEVAGNDGLWLMRRPVASWGLTEEQFKQFAFQGAPGIDKFMTEK